LVAMGNGIKLPTTLAEAHQFLETYIPKSLGTIDEQAGGKPEGLVIRTPDRKIIAKMRFEDYKRAERKAKMEKSNAR